MLSRFSSAQRACLPSFSLSQFACSDTTRDHQAWVGAVNPSTSEGFRSNRAKQPRVKERKTNIILEGNPRSRRRLSDTLRIAFGTRKEKMIAAARVIHMRVCFADRLKNANILVGTTDEKEARRIARLWGEKAEGQNVTRTIIHGLVQPHGGETTDVQGTTVWLPLF